MLLSHARALSATNNHFFMQENSTICGILIKGPKISHPCGLLAEVYWPRCDERLVFILITRHSAHFRPSLAVTTAPVPFLRRWSLDFRGGALVSTITATHCSSSNNSYPLYSHKFKLQVVCVLGVHACCGGSAACKCRLFCYLARSCPSKLAIAASSSCSEICAPGIVVRCSCLTWQTELDVSARHHHTTRILLTARGACCLLQPLQCAAYASPSMIRCRVQLFLPRFWLVLVILIR